MSIWQSLTNPRTSRQVTPRRVALFAISLVVLVGVVLFNQDIINLFKWLRGGAAGEGSPFEVTAWVKEHDTQLGHSNAKLIDVTIPTIPVSNPDAGKRYLYLIGGIETKVIEGKDRLRLINTVERIRLDKDTGEIFKDEITKEKVQWEFKSGSSSIDCLGGTGNWSYMCSGHAEFGVLQSDDLKYLYVISGDIHIPKNDSTHSPLLFSTIERLDLTDSVAGWKPIALLTGVNFYPEILKFDNRIHIIGGIYGNPFSKGYVWSWNGYEFKDPLLPADDVYNKWDVYKDLPKIGGPVVLPNGGLGSNVMTGQGGSSVDPPIIWPVIMPGGGTVSVADDQVHIQQTPKQNLADTLIRVLMSGKFVTSVSEHYIINPYTDPISVDLTSELGKKTGSIDVAGNDYIGKLYDVWTAGKVMHIAHLRLGVDNYKGIGWPYKEEYQVYPAPQGRYGHKAFVQDDVDGKPALWVVGGASWSSPIERSRPVIDMNQNNYRYFYTFWVIDDTIHPITRQDTVDFAPPYQYWSYKDQIAFDLPGEDHEYQYAGNITYQWNGNSKIWKGTNDEYGLNDPTVPPFLYDRHALQKDMLPSGRAFFAFAQLKPDPDDTEALAVGGLENNDIAGVGIDGVASTIPELRIRFSFPAPVEYGISILLTDRVEKLAKNDTGWQPRATTNGIGAVYGASAFSVGPLALAFGGQTEFLSTSDEPFSNDHVPAYERAVSAKTAGYADTGEEGAWYAFSGTNYGWAYPATLDVRTAFASGGENIYIYKATGSLVGGSDDLPTAMKGVESLGMFQYGGQGIVDWSKSTFTITPKRLDSQGGYYHWPSGDTTPQVYADHHDYALVTLNLKDYYGEPALVDVGVGATLYTDRSPKPAVRKESAQDWIRLVGSAPGLSLPASGWAGQFSPIDLGGNEDGNLNTGKGQAQFYISSNYRTFNNDGTPGWTSLSIYIANTITGTGLADGPLATPLNDTRLIFTKHGVPVNSTLAATSPVQTNPPSDEQSTVTGTLIDYYHDKVPGIETIIESNRNLDTDPDGYLIIKDIITAVNSTSNDQGKVVFKVKSALKDWANITGYYIPPVKAPDEPDEPGAEQRIGYRTTYIYFNSDGRFTLFPESARQGDQFKEPAPMVATGDLVSWDTTTTAKFIPPNAVSFLYLTPEGTWSTNINQLMLYADKTVTSFALIGESLSAAEQLYLEIVDGGGHFFYPGYPDNITINADKPLFNYISGDTPGILKIEVKLNDNNGNKIGELWLPVIKIKSYVQVAVTAVPKSLDVGGSAEITATVTHNGIPIYDLTTITFTKDDGTQGQFSQQSGVTDGVATITYTRVGNQAGEVHIFASVDYSAGNWSEKASNRVAVQKTASGVPAEQTITYDPAGIVLAKDPIIPQRMTLTFGGSTGVKVGSGAPVGVWTFMTSTPIEPSFELPDKVETTSFLVEPALSTFPTILSLEPFTGILGHTGGYDIKIEAANTAFVWSGTGLSVITFTPVNGGDPVTVPIVSGDPYNNPTHLKVHWDIAADAPWGWWDVKVLTGGELAEMLINDGKDFLVTTENRYRLDLVAVPSQITRNGTDTSEITATATYLDANGDVIPSADKLITFDFVPGNLDDGKLAPKVPPGDHTDSAGVQTWIYTTDGPNAATDIAEIRVSVKVDATTTIVGTVKITKNGLGGDEVDITKSWIDASTPVWISTDGTDYSTVTVTLLNNAGTPLSKSVTLSTSRPTKDNIKLPNPKDTNVADGKAVFQVWSSATGPTTITATIGVTKLSKDVDFIDPATSAKRFFILTVPFQSQDYDNWVKVKIKENGGKVNIYGDYKKNARPDNLLADLKGVPFYLYTASSYTVWVKGENHLAASKTTVKASDADGAGIITINFGSLKIGDIATGTDTTNFPVIPGGFHDNVIGKMSGLTSTDDLGLLVNNWFKVFNLGDFNQDGIVNTVDMLYLFLNWGSGALMP